MTIATATPEDYRQSIEGKSALDSIFERISVEEVSGNIAIQILEAKAGAIEHQTKVYFSYDAIAKTVTLSSRYLHERYLPEKAIEILQEVATRVAETRGDGGVVTANDVAAVVSAKTNIPLTELTAEESAKLLSLEDRIHQRVVNQVEAVDMVAASIRRARAEMRDSSRPVVNLLFLGPTGVGKTELAKTVAEIYFGHEQNMIRLDMSEYQEKTSVNRLLGFDGGNQAGYLTEAVRKNPFSLVLLDEIEKAHPDILNLFLQVMDDGRLTDATGRTVDFTNVILIATSNAGTQFIQDQAKAGKSTELIRSELVDQVLPQHFRPEFLNRFDGIVVFKPLSMEHVRQIAKLMLRKVVENLEQRGIALVVTDGALAVLADAGFSREFGARSLRRVIQEHVQDVLANYLLSGKLGRRDTVTIQPDGELVITKAKPF